MSAYTTEARPAKYDTANGGTVQVYRIGIELEFEYRNPSGATVATVRMSNLDGRRLINQIESALGRDF